MASHDEGEHEDVEVEEEQDDEAGEDDVVVFIVVIIIILIIIIITINPLLARRLAGCNPICRAGPSEWSFVMHHRAQHV